MPQGKITSSAYGQEIALLISPVEEDHTDFAGTSLLSGSVALALIGEISLASSVLGTLAQAFLVAKRANSFR